MSTANTSSDKTCFKCGTQQPLTEFYRHSRMADGHLNKCKSCTKSDVSKNRLKNIDAFRAYDRLRAKLPHRKKLALELERIRRRLDRRKTHCHNKLTRAVRKGLIDRMPCIVCGEKRTHAHHESYDRPLDVVWYCAVHHSARHRQMAIEGIDP